ncbi:MAG: hypothetical protein QM756_34960 [Polyangiaceae bacterium]
MKLKMGWLPPGSKLNVNYAETWSSSTDNASVQTQVTFPAKGSPESSNLDLSPAPLGTNGVKLTALKTGLKRERTNTDQKIGSVRVPEPDLKRVEVNAHLSVSFEATASFTIPHTGSQTKVLYSR